VASKRITSVSFNPAGTHLAVGTDRGHFDLYDVEKGVKVRGRSFHTARVGVITWKPNGVCLTGSRDCNIGTWDFRDNFSPLAKKEYNPQQSPHDQEICGLAWDDELSYLASGGNDNIVKIWDKRNVSTPLFTYKEHVSAVKAMAWSPHRRGILATGSGSADRSLRIWNTMAHPSSACLVSTDTYSQVCGLMWSPSREEILTTHGYTDYQMLLWGYNHAEKTIRATDRITGHRERVLYMGVSPDSSCVCTGSADDTVRFWNMFPEVGEQNAARIDGHLAQSSSLPRPR
jgi:cell division cycle 20-like protein 1, cofactor of APC complex